MPSDQFARTMKRKSIGVAAGLASGALLGVLLAYTFRQIGWPGGDAIAAIFGMFVIFPVFKLLDKPE